MLEIVEEEKPDESVTVALIALCRSLPPFESLLVLFGPVESELLYPSVILPIHCRPQNAGALGSNYLPWRQHSRLSRLRISTCASMLFFYRKFSKSADENIFTILQGLFNQLEKGLDYLG